MDLTFSCVSLYFQAIPLNSLANFFPTFAIHCTYIFLFFAPETRITSKKCTCKINPRRFAINNNDIIIYKLFCIPRGFLRQKRGNTKVLRYTNVNKMYVHLISFVCTEYIMTTFKLEIIIFVHLLAIEKKKPDRLKVYWNCLLEGRSFVGTRRRSSLNFAWKLNGNLQLSAIYIGITNSIKTPYMTVNFWWKLPIDFPLALV